MSTGKALPEEIITNDDLSRIVDTNDEWITTRTGIKKRYRCTHENTTSLAVRAAYEAVEASGVDIAEIGAVIVAPTADNAFPSTAAIVQKELDWLPAAASLNYSRRHHHPQCVLAKHQHCRVSRHHECR